MKAKINLTNIRAYIQGEWRYRFFYSEYFWFLIRGFIREQIDIRIQIMDEKCFDSGSCKLCGCTTTALQMANKSCDKPCYPPIMSRGTWKAFKEESLIYMKKGESIGWMYENENSIKQIKIRDYVDRRTLGTFSDETRADQGTGL